MLKLAFASAVLAALTRTSDAAGVGNFFTYFEQGGFGPSNWAFLDIDGNQCGGTQGQSGFGQSPVSISEDTLNTCDTSMSAYSFTGGDCNWEQLDFSISNNGVKVAPKADAGCSFGNMNIPHSPNQFNALQFHIHTYSEHQIVGIGDEGFFPAELHVVHQEVTEESFAVFGTMIDVGPTEHPVFEYFLQGWEAAAGAIEDTCPTQRLRGLAETEFKPVQEVVQCQAIGSRTAPTNLTFPAFFPPNVYELPTNPDFGVFTYKGGLTTPGCTEIVNWNLLDTAMLISQAQMSRLQRLILCFVQQNFDDNGVTVKSCNFGTVADEAGSTSRPPQPLAGRRIIHRCRAGPNEVIDDVGTPVPEAAFAKPAPREEPANTKKGDCNKAIFEACSDDPRFNPNISPNLKASEPAWNDAEGFWVGTLKAYNARGESLLENFASEKIRSTIPYPSDDVKVFVNITVQETRYYEHVYYVYQPAASIFCSLPVPTEATNVLGDGTCGETGYVVLGERFGTATFEKDGHVDIIFANGRFSDSTEGEAIPVDGRTFYTSVGNSNFSIAETYTFSNEALTQITGSGQYFLFTDTGAFAENPLLETYTFVLEQVSSETFMEDLMAAQDAANVPEGDKLMTITSGDCVDNENCPSEELFQETDPLTADSPYEEDTGLKPGFIALFALLGFGVVAIGLYFLHKKRINNQADRYKDQFAKRVAENIKFTGGEVTPEALQLEFERLDADGNGVLSMNEMKEFMGQNMDERDFNAMFAAMDTDGNGTIEFAEFCGFLSRMEGAFEASMDTSGSDSN